MISILLQAAIRPFLKETTTWESSLWKQIIHKNDWNLCNSTMYALCTIFTIRRTFFVNPSFFAIFFLPKSTTKAWREACELQDLPKNVSTIMKIIHDGYEYFIILFEEAAPGTEFINNAHCVLDQSVHTECTQREGPGLLYLKVDRRPTTAWKILWYTYLCTSRWPRPFLNLHHVYTTNEASIIVFSSYL